MRPFIIENPETKKKFRVHERQKDFFLTSDIETNKFHSLAGQDLENYVFKGWCDE
jgi:hypothetical protein